MGAAQAPEGCWLRAEIRRARLQWKKGTLSDAQYEQEVNDYMKYAIEEQEKMGMDVLVHGEPERTDMCALRLCLCAHVGMYCHAACALLLGQTSSRQVQRQCRHLCA